MKEDVLVLALLGIIPSDYWSREGMDVFLLYWMQI